MSFGQERLWFLHHLYPESTAYNMHGHYALDGALNPALLKASVNKVVARHDVLRTSFAALGGRPAPVVLQSLSVDVPFHDLQMVPVSARRERANQIARGQATEPFDLAAPPLIRVAIVRFEDREHEMSLTLHHIVADEWSLEVFWRELADAYCSLSGEGESRLGPLPIQYPDFAAWQRERMGELRESIDYWERKLDTPPPGLELPSNSMTPAPRAPTGKFRAERLPRELSNSIRERARRGGTSLFVFLLTAFQTLLSRYTGESDITVGTPVSQRDRIETQSLIGFFVNTVLMRVDLSGDPTFAGALKRVHDSALEAFAHQDVPFEELVRRAGARGPLHENPLFRVMFVLQQESGEVELAKELVVRSLPPIDLGVSKFDWTVFVSEVDGVFETRMEHDTAVLDSETVDRAFGHWRILLEAIAEDPERRISKLPLLTQVERAQLLDGRTDSYASACTHELFEEFARTNPGVTAVVDASRSWSYAELDAQAERVSQRLRSVGIELEERVAIFTERSVEMLSGILGVHKAGGAYVPLDPDTPSERVRFMLDDADVRVVLTQAELENRLPKAEREVIVLDEDASDGFRERAVPSKARLSQLAYVIYTSGSTGTPKGVMITHESLAHSSLARTRYYGESPGRFLLLSSVAFDSSVAGIFWTLAQGGTLIVPPAGAERDALRIASLVADERVTHLLCLPSIYAILLEHHPERLDTLQAVMVAGEVCPRDLVEAHHDRLPSTRLYNEYGPTEATVWSTVHHASQADETGPVPIGRPIPGAEVFVLDDNKNPVPVGVCGELYIGGPGLARGYLNQPELTSAGFLPHPFRDTPGARLYRSGDLARFRSDGELIFMGRRDRQVKIRGHRIELEEIEDVVARHAAVAEVAVDAVEDAVVAESAADRFERRLRSLGAPTAERLLSGIESLSDDDVARLLEETD